MHQRPTSPLGAGRVRTRSLPRPNTDQGSHRDTADEPRSDGRAGRFRESEPSIALTVLGAFAIGAIAVDILDDLAFLLDSLVVAPEHHVGYDRDLFHTWIDSDGDGCNTRYEVLIDEAVVAPRIVGSCDLVGGVWHSAFDDVDLHGAPEVQIDHLVALAEAWYSGAYAWSPERREAFANDIGTPVELNGVSGQVNESKGSYDPAQWVPPAPEALCPYVDAWITTKVRWQLTIDIDERDALRAEVERCQGTSP